jgi:NHL repeat-containing protein
VSGVAGADAGFPSLLRSESRGVVAVSGFGRPFGLARDGEGRIHVVDMDLHAICRLSPDLRRAQWFAGGTGWSDPLDISEGSASPAQARAPGCFNGPHSIAVGRDGRLYVVTYYAPGLHIIAGRDEGIVVSSAPVGLAGPATGHFDQAGRLLIAEYKLHAILAVSAEGRFLGALGGGHDGFIEGQGFAAGNGRSEFDRPHMCKDRADGALIVADTWNHRLQLFTGNGRFRGVLGGGMREWCDEKDAITPTGREPGAFSAPVAVSMAEDGRFVVTDWGNNRLQWFDHDGRLLTVEEPGLDRPYDAQIFDRRLVVADTHHGRLLFRNL